MPVYALRFFSLKNLRANAGGLFELSHFLFLELPANISLAFSIPLVLLRAHMSPADKEKYSNAVPQSFDEIMCGVMLGEG